MLADTHKQTRKKRGSEDSVAVNSAGWLAVFGAFVGFLLSYSTLGVLVLSLLTEPLSNTFGWTRSEISIALMVFVVTAVTLSLPIGVLMDRRGVRWILLPSLLVFGLVLGSMYYLTASVTHFYVAYFLLGLSAASTLPHSYTRVIVGWFDRQRGQALGVAATGAAVGMILFPPAMTWVLLHYGWQEVYLAGALLVLLVCLPVVGGYLQENRVATSLRDYNSRGSAFGGLVQATKSSKFWVMFIAFSLLGFGTIGPIPHLIPMLLDMGVGAMSAAYALSFYGVAAVIGRLICGLLLDRLPAPRVAVAFALSPLAACVFLAVHPDFVTGLTAAALFGIGAGAEIDLMAFMISRYLKITAFAQIYAVIFAGFYVVGAIGMATLGYLFDKYGTYTNGLWFMSLMITAALVMLGGMGRHSTATDRVQSDDNIS